jgi:predicted nucleotidyltransferase
LESVSNTVLTLDTLRSRREEILAAARRRRASNVRVFGSVSRGEAEPGSDVDFLVDFDAEASLLDQVGLTQDLEELLGVAVDVVSSGGLRPYHDPIREQATEL